MVCSHLGVVVLVCGLQRPDQDDEHSRKLKNRMAKKQEERDLAHDTAMLLKAKHDAMVNQVVHVLD